MRRRRAGVSVEVPEAAAVAAEADSPKIAVAPGRKKRAPAKEPPLGNSVLEAGYVYAEDDDEVLMVGFADRQVDTEHYLLLEGSKEIDPGDEDGMEGVYLEIDDQIRSIYGGIRSIELEEDVLTLHLEPHAAKQLRTGPTFVVRFEASPAERADMVKGLTALFASTPEIFSRS